MDTYLDYARRGRNEWWRYVLTLALALIVAMVVGTGLMLALVLLAHIDPSGLTNARNPIEFFAANGVLFAILAAFLAIFARPKSVQSRRPTRSPSRLP